MEEYFYPQAKEWMWTYCVFLGKYTDRAGNNFDLGVYVDDHGYVSGAIVDGNEPGDYWSPDFAHVRDGLTPLEHYETRVNHYLMAEAYIETIKRAMARGIIK